MKIKFDVSGMTCAACSARVEKVTSAVPGVERVEVNLLAGTMQVEADNDTCKDLIISAVQNAGYGASVSGEKRAVEPEKKKRFSSILMHLSVFMILLAYFHYLYEIQWDLGGYVAGMESIIFFWRSV